MGFVSRENFTSSEFTVKAIIYKISAGCWPHYQGTEQPHVYLFLRVGAGFIDKRAGVGGGETVSNGAIGCRRVGQ